MSNKSSFLFIPDIRGFTKFVQNTAIAHSQHIISELLEILIDTNELGMEVSEIEGDAVFFYKYKSIPDYSAVLRQIEKMFIAFHKQLKLYENNRICQCGACSTAADLSVKFVVHAGDFEFIEVKGHKKPYGSDVIVVHRLLKNNIEMDEYALITQDYLNTQSPITANSWIEPKTGQVQYENIGEIAYQYIPLDSLLGMVTVPLTQHTGTVSNRPVVVDTIIHKPKALVYEIVSNFDYRHEWNPDVDAFEYEENRVNRQGTKHFCVIGNNKIEFETVSRDTQGAQLIYGEKARIPLVKEFTSYYLLETPSDLDEDKPESTKLSIEVHYKPWPIIGWLLIPFFKRTIRQGISQNILMIKEVSEQKAAFAYYKPDPSQS